MNSLQVNWLDGSLASFGALFFAGFVMTAPWRVLGVLLARNIDIESQIFKWVRAVSTALVAGLIARMVVFPSGALVSIALPIRLIAFAGGVAVYYLARRNMGLGVIAGIAILLGGHALLS